MIDVKQAQDLISHHRSLAEERQGGLLSRAHAMYANNLYGTSDDNAGLYGGKESVEDGSIYGVVDTKVAATTPLRPRIAVTPEILEEYEPGAPPELHEEIDLENRRRRSFAEARQRYLHHVFDAGALHATLKRVNAMARVAPHAFLRADWSTRYGRPVVRAYSPLEVWADETQDCWEDVEYVIHATFVRKGQVEARVKSGLYPADMDLSRRLTYGDRPTWSRLTSGTYKPDSFVKTATVYEVFDLVNGRVLHVAQDLPTEPLLEQDTPYYRFLPNPFFYLTFVEYLAGLRGMSDGEILMGPAQRLARLASIEYFSGKAGVPDYVLNTNAVDDPRTLEEQWARPRRPGSTLKVALRNGVGPSDVVGLTPTPNVQAALAGPKQTAQADLAFRAGVPNYQRGEPEPRVAATYGALQQQAEATRRGWDIRVMQSAVVWWCNAAISLAEEFMPAHEVVSIQEMDPTGRPGATSKVWRGSMDFRDPAEHAHAESIGATPPDARTYFYSMEPFEDPMTKNPQAQIALDMQMLQAASTGMVPLNPMAIAESLRQSLGRGPDFILQGWTPPAQQTPGNPPGAPGAPPPSPDNVAAGGMPPGVAPIPTLAQGAMAGGAGAPAPIPAGAGASAFEPTVP